MDPLTFILIGVVAFFIYRSHQRKVGNEAVSEVILGLRELSAIRDQAGDPKPNQYTLISEALMEARAAVIAKRQVEYERADQISRLLLRSLDQKLLNSLGIYEGTARAGRCSAGLFSLARDFEKLNSGNRAS